MSSHRSFFVLRLLPVVACILLGGLAAPAAHATDYTWQDGASSDWTDSSRWLGGPAGSVPGAGDTVTINAGHVRLTSNVTIGTLNWNGGLIGDKSGNVNLMILTVTAALNMGGTAEKVLALDSTSGDFEIISNGTTTWSGTGGVNMSQFAGATGTTQFVNGGNFNIQNDTYFAADFVNTAAGTVTKQSGAANSNSSFNRLFNNSGTVRAQGGNLRLTGGGNAFGSCTYDAATGAALSLGGKHTVNGTATFSGAGRVIIGGAGGSGTLSITAGRLTHVTGIMELASSVVEGEGELKVNGTLDWNNSTMRGTGTTTIDTGGRLEISGGTLDTGRILNNKGTAVGETSNLYISSSAFFTNKSGAQFNFEGPPSFEFNVTGSNGGQFNNEAGATITKTKTSVSTISVPFTNAGTVKIQEGTLHINNGGISSGVFNTAALASLIFGTDSLGPTYTFGSGTSFTGIGPVDCRGNTAVSLGATVNCDSIFGIKDFGTLKINLGGTFNSKGTFYLEGGIVDGSGALNVSGPFFWHDGTMKGTGGETNILATGNMEVSTSPSTIGTPTHTLESRNLNNSGVITLKGTGSLGDSLAMRSGAIVKNSKTINFVRNFYINDNGGNTERIDNLTDGVINCNSLGTTFLQNCAVGVIFHNDGTVNVTSGSFILGAGGSSSKAFNIAAGALLEIAYDSSTPFTINVGTTFAGAGTTRFAGNISVVSSATVTIPAGHTLVLTGLLEGGGNLTVDGTLDWQSGIMRGGGVTRVNAGGTALLSAGEFDQGKDMTNRTFNNFGTTTWTGDNMTVGQGAFFTNESGATFTVNCDRNLGLFATDDPQASFTNKTGATFSKTGAGGTTTWAVPFTNAGSVNLQSGTLNFQFLSGDYVQTIGFTNLLGGNLSALKFNNTRSNIDIQGGLVTGTGTINANVINNGHFKPGQTQTATGVLAISGNYTQTANGKLDIKIGGISAGTQYDQVQVGGIATIDGLLNIVRLNSYAPSPGDPFLVLAYASRTGSFSLAGTDFGSVLLKPRYNDTDLTLVAEPRKITIEDVTITEGTGGVVTAMFSVLLSDASTGGISVQFSTSNGTATSPADYTANSGVVTFTNGQVLQTISVAVQGDAVDEDEETFNVNLFNAGGAVIEDATAIGTIVDNDAPPAIRIPDMSVAEGSSGGFTSATYNVTLSAASSFEVKVNFATIDGNAVAPTDYTATAGTLIFAPGTTSRTITVPIRADALDEPNETYRVNLSSPVNATIADNQALGTIRDDDPTPAIAINNVTIVEGNTGTKIASFTVSLSAASGQQVSVSAIPSNGTARAPGDYTEGGVRLTFNPGQTSKVFNVEVKGDTLDEPNETFFVLLSSPTNAGIGVGRGTGTITDDDSPPTIAIEDLGIGEGNTGQRIAAVRLKLSAPSGQIVRVNAATVNGTATAGTTTGSDYMALPSTQISFTAGNLYAYARITINGDVLTEANETIKVNLSAPVNATIVDTQGICTILNDDPAPSMAIDDVSISEGNSGTKNLTLTVTLSKASGQTITVNYASADGTARVSTGDYVAKNGTLTFAPGTTSKTISIVVNGDAVVEADESLFVLLSGAVNASISKARGTGTITNDDSSN